MVAASSTRAEAPRRRALGWLLGLAALSLVGHSLPAFALTAHAADAPIANVESSAPAAGEQLEGRALLRALRAGGNVIYFRHTATDHAKNDAAMRSMSDCANQRLLSAQGRADAKRIGVQLRALKLPQGEVFASPMCRTMDHATLAFKRATPKPQMREGGAEEYPGLKRLLAEPVPAGSNRWLVGHGIPFRAVAGPPHLAEGEAVVIRPLGNGWAVLARLAPDDWARLGTAP